LSQISTEFLFEKIVVIMMLVYLRETILEMSLIYQIFLLNYFLLNQEKVLVVVLISLKV
ncbi:MAG: hypothetical protein RL023_821, partial [Candidatus Parcubacteria bacterium]